MEAVMQQHIFSIRLLVVLGALLTSSAVSAALVNLEFSFSFGATPASGPAPWLAAEFDDSIGGASTVRLTVSAFGSLSDADVTQLYFNLDPQLDPARLTFMRMTPEDADLGAITIATGVDAYMADGDGSYDVFLDLPTGGNGQRLNAGETLVYDITYTGDLSAVGNELTAASFFFLSTPGPGNNPGPFLAAAHLQSTGADLQGSDWVAAVPIPAAIWLFTSSLALLGNAVRRRR
jgi:hypothetical protein